MTSFTDDLLEQKTIEKSLTFDTRSFGILLLWNLECRERRLVFYLFSIPANFFPEQYFCVTNFKKKTYF